MSNNIMVHKILIVEDEPYLLEMYKTKFEKEKFTVLTAGDGETGLAIARKDLPDLILLDIVMPVMNGYEFLLQIKNDEKTKAIKVYVLSNLGQASEITKGYNAGADNYLIKANLTPNQLVEIVKDGLTGKQVAKK